MFQLIKLEFLKLYKSLLIFSVCSTILCISLVLIFMHGYSYQYKIEIWGEAYTLILFLFPMFCTMPVTWLLFHEKKHNFISYSIIRLNSNKYYFSKLIVHCLYGFLITFFMSMLILLLCLYMVPSINGLVNPIDVFQLDTFINHPLFYGLILSLWRSVLSIPFVLLGFIVSLLFRNMFIVLILPFGYYILENVILSILGMPYYRMITSIGVVSGGYTADLKLWYLFVGPSLLIVCTCAFFIVAWKQKVFGGQSVK